MSTIRLQCMALVKLHHGQPLTPEKAAVDLRSLLAKAESIAAHMPKRRTLSVSFEVAPGLGLVLTDGGWLLMCLINFLSNVRARRPSRPNSCVRLPQ